MYTGGVIAWERRKVMKLSISGSGASLHDEELAAAMSLIEHCCEYIYMSMVLSF